MEFMLRLCSWEKAASAATAEGGAHPHSSVYRIGMSGDFTWGCDVLEPFESVLEQGKLMVCKGIEIKKC